MKEINMGLVSIKEYTNIPNKFLVKKTTEERLIFENPKKRHHSKQKDYTHNMIHRQEKLNTHLKELMNLRSTY